MVRSTDSVVVESVLAWNSHHLETGGEGNFVERHETVFYKFCNCT